MWHQSLNGMQRKQSSQWSPKLSGSFNFSCPAQCPLWTCILVALVLILTLSARSIYYWHGYASRLVAILGGGASVQSYQGKGTWNSVSVNASKVLECFQVHQPVLTASGWNTKSTSEDVDREAKTYTGLSEEANSCSVLLMKHSFGFSYGHPFVGE